MGQLTCAFWDIISYTLHRPFREIKVLHALRKLHVAPYNTYSF
jgi:hypothetical protein